MVTAREILQTAMLRLKLVSHVRVDYVLFPLVGIHLPVSLGGIEDPGLYVELFAAIVACLPLSVSVQAL